MLLSYKILTHSFSYYRHLVLSLGSHRFDLSGSAYELHLTVPLLMHTNRFGTYLYSAPRSCEP